MSSTTSAETDIGTHAFQNSTAVETLRALAVALVFTHHLQSGMGLTVPLFASIGGWLGVQIFFVISGYLIVTSAQKYPASIYIKHRLCRIYPAYLFWFLLLNVWTIYTPHTGGTQQPEIKWSDWLIHLTFLQHLFPSVYVKLNALMVTWTLTAEFIWYLFALVIAKKHLHRLVPIAVAAIGVAYAWNQGLVFVLYPRLDALSDVDKVFFAANLFVAQLPYFMLGALIAVKKPQFHAAGLLAIVIVTLVPSPFWQMHFLFPFVLTGFGASALLLMLQKISYTNPTWVRFLSDVSYSFYLIHYPIILVTTKHIGANWLAAGIALSSTLLMAWISNKLIERPFIRWAKNAPKPAKTLQLAH